MNLSHWSQRCREGWFILVVTVAAYVLLALCSYHAMDPGWSHASSAGANGYIFNAGGKAGAWLADVLLYLSGYLAFVLPLVSVYMAYRVCWAKQDRSVGALSRLWQSLSRVLRVSGWLLALVSAAALCHHWLTLPWLVLRAGSGGVVGMTVYTHMLGWFNAQGANLWLVAGLLIGLTLATGLSWLRLCEYIGRYVWQATAYLTRFSTPASHYLWRGMRAAWHMPVILWRRWAAIRAARLAVKKASLAAAKKMAPKIVAPPVMNVASSASVSSAPSHVDAPSAQQGIASSAKKPLEIGSYAGRQKPVDLNKMHRATGELPDINLLDPVPDNREAGLSKAVLESRSRDLEIKLSDFNISAQVVAVYPGPVVTRYELQLAPGTKVSKITTLSKDIARSLSVMSVRVVEVIEGKSVIGIELPNEKREMVYLQETLASSQYVDAHSNLTMALGKDIAGHPVAVDLAKMPHLLVAGTTGSGKSVGLNAMLMSLLYKSTPDQLRLIMIDPKMLELSIYDGIPHLLVPVVTDMKEASNALRWCVIEMERRYRLMSALGVRNIAGYNTKVAAAIKSGKPIMDPLISSNAEIITLEPLPKIVILADEFADMMMVVGKKIETLIARLAQKARAAGIHLILATQRPSVDVITGLIKANIPTRIAFQVSSRIDSRTILDQQGAEQLLGHGDMLYLPPGSGVPVRVHGAFVDDDEVHRVVEFLKKTGKPSYVEEILSDPGATADPVINAAFGEESADAEQDALYDQALAFVAKTRRASVSGVQRQFKIGYNRAARLVEQMERAGAVSAMENNGSREVLVPPPMES